MGFEKSGLAGHFGVVGGVAFIETVAGEEFDIVPNRFTHFAAIALGHGAVGELDAMFIDQFFLLFGDRFTDHIGFAGFVASETAGDTDNLFLVDTDTVGVAPNRFKVRMVVDDLFFAVHAFDVGGDVFHRAGAVEGDGGDDVVEAAGAHIHHETAHTSPFNLEDAGDFAAGEHIEEGFRFFSGVGADVAGVVGDVVHGVDGAIPLFDEAGGAAHDGEGTEAEEVDFEEAD